MRELFELERALAGVMSLADLAGPVSKQVGRLAGAANSAVFQFLEPGVISIQEGHGADVLAGYTPDLGAEDLTQPFNLALPPTAFIPSGEGFDVERFLRSRPYTDFYGPRDIGDMRGIWPTGLPYGAPQMFGLLLYTPSFSRPFVAQKLDMVRRLELPFRTLARRVARFRALEQKQGVLHQLLERQRGAFVLWDADGRLILMSATAQQYLGSALPRSDLEHAAALALRQLRRTETSGRDAFLGRPRQLQGTRGAPLLVEFSWVAAADRRPWLLAELQSCSGASALLAQLSGAEVRVLRLLACGLSNREISEQLTVSSETVKTHVKHILCKLGVSSRAKAVRIAAQVWGSAAATLKPSTEDS